MCIAIRKCKEQWLEERCCEVENSARNQNPPHKLFQTVNEICGHPKTTNSRRQKWEADNKSDTKNRWKQYYNERNPVDNAAVDELPTSNYHEHLADILRELKRWR